MRNFGIVQKPLTIGKLHGAIGAIWSKLGAVRFQGEDNTATWCTIVHGEPVARWI